MNNERLTFKKNRLKRIIIWVIVYLLIFIFFLFIVILQSSNVNTLQFPAGQIELTTNKYKYYTGETISYTITNKLENKIELLNHCPNEPLHIYEWLNYSWKRVLAKSSQPCTSNKPIIIQPNKSYTNNLNNFASLFKKPGIFRIVAYADNYTSLPFADFIIISKSNPIQPQIIYKPVYTPVYTPIYVRSPSGGDGSSKTGGDN